MPPLFTHPPSSLATPPSVFRCLSTVISFGSNIRNIDLSTCTRNLLENICVSFIVAPNRAYSINICNKIYAYNGNNGRINKSDSSFRVLTLRPSFPLRTVDSPLLFPSSFGGKRSSSCFDAADFFSLEYFLAPSPVVTQSGHELHFLTYLYVLGNETMQREIWRTGRTFGGSFDIRKRKTTSFVFTTIPRRTFAHASPLAYICTSCVETNVCWMRRRRRR